LAQRKSMSRRVTGRRTKWRQCILFRAVSQGPKGSSGNSRSIMSSRKSARE
jgi:hypothetical protein